jgi:AcrR family transcriptional regulator
MNKPVPEKRPYQQTRRAELASQTRQRIVEAALDLHGRVGPAQTTVSMVAAEAGVQRHTFYAHFPDERSLYLACSGLMLERDPLPTAESWRAVTKALPRLAMGLGAIYAWYGRNADALASVLRDAEHHPLTREIVDLRMTPHVTAFHEVLGEHLDAQQKPLLRLALSFYTWRSLVLESGLSHDAAVEKMARMICGG